MIACPRCGALARPGANMCLDCGADLRPARQAAAPGGEPKNGFLQRLARGLFGDPGAEDGAQSTAGSPAGSPADGPAASGESAAQAQQAAPAARAPKARLLDNRYALLKTLPLPASVYYEALDLLCPVCAARYEQPVALQGAARCVQCDTDMRRCLIRETDGPEPAMPSSAIARMSQTTPGVVAHYRVFHAGDKRYAVMSALPGWQPLSHIAAPAALERALQWHAGLVEAMAGLHERGITWGTGGPASLEAILLLDGGREARLGDLSHCRMLPSGSAPAGARARAHIQRDVATLARALAFALARTDVAALPAHAPVPAAARETLAAALRGEFERVEDFAARLREAGLKPGTRPLPAAPARVIGPLQSAALAGDAGGRGPGNNEDRGLALSFTRVAGGATVPVGLYAVADGMGGNAAGEVASETARRVLAETVSQAFAGAQALPPDPAALLAGAIQAANAAVHAARQGPGGTELSNMGTTVTAALAIGTRAFIANVGDSRTYLLRGTLVQLTVDHSFAGQLAAAGAISAEQARVHPQRRVLVRALGEEAAVEVDSQALDLQAGDQLLLCSDGLWEALRDEAIGAVLAAAETPQAAADALLRAALDAGADDNVTVIVARFG